MENHFDFDADRMPNSIFYLSENSYLKLKDRLEELCQHEWQSAVVSHNNGRVTIAVHLTASQAELMQGSIRLAKLYAKVRSN